MIATSTEQEIRQAAINYVNANLAIIPVNPQTKTPYTTHGSHDASRDPEQVKLWWDLHPDASIGIATGKVNGLIVVDLDVDPAKGVDGVAELRAWERNNCTLPETWRAITGRGGAHLYYCVPPDYEVHNTVKYLDCIDIRGEGGYVIAPPSLHPNGKRYEWECDPDDYDLAVIDDAVKRLLDACSKESALRKKNDEGHFVMPEKVYEGQRDNILYKAACKMQAEGYPDEAIYGAMERMNQKCFTPPLAIEYVQEKVRYVISRYIKGRPILFDSEGEIVAEYHEPVIDRKEGKDGEPGRAKQTIANFTEAIQFDRALYGKLRWNELTCSPHAVGPLPWNAATIDREFTNADDTELRQYLEQNYGLVNKEPFVAGFNNAVHHNSYNPVIEFLEDAYRRWDGKTGHVAKLLPDYLSVDDTPYQAEAMKLMMLGAVCRAYCPGCKFDHIMVLVGAQGGGKSSFIRLLFQNDAWFNDNFNTIEGDKASEKLRGMWAVEIAELLAMKKIREVEAVKSFITSTDDVYRTPYDRFTESHPRRCVFFGTTNDTQFLTDKTGNRRFLPILTRTNQRTARLPSEQARFTVDATQAWGEMVGAYKAAMQQGGLPALVLPRSVMDEAEEEQNAYLQEDPKVGCIQAWLEDNNPEFTCVQQLYEEALQGANWRQMTSLEIKQIHQIMQTMPGWVPYGNKSGRKRMGKYGTVKCYARDDVNAKFTAASDEADDDDLPEDFY